MSIHYGVAGTIKPPRDKATDIESDANALVVSALRKFNHGFDHRSLKGKASGIPVEIDIMIELVALVVVILA